MAAAKGICTPGPELTEASLFWESWQIKEGLLANIEAVEGRLANRGEDADLDEALIAVEQFVFWAAFAVRKLADSFKLSDEFERRTLLVGADLVCTLRVPGRSQRAGSRSRHRML